ncbi:MAG: hypothetical protein DPW09_10280, partial [Anaerolineae bacterium]|nr:hypothetical protein [Anaerolineae bacterium]
MERDLGLEQLQQGIYAAFKSWHKTDEGDSPFANLVLFRQQQNTTPRKATNKILFQALESLSLTHRQEAALLSRHFLDGEKMQSIAHEKNIGEATAYRWQNDAIAQLAHVLQAHEREARAQRQSILAKRLERPTYTQLIGVDSQIEALLVVL